jgi:hypothetical protein
MAIEKLISGNVYQGTISTFIPYNKKFSISSDGEFKVQKINPDTGEVLESLNSDNMRLVSKSPGTFQVVPKNKTTQFWSIFFQDENRTYEKSDPIPFEVNIDNPPSIMDRMRVMIQEEFMNKYGDDSREIETLEEALDFDIDNDGEIGFTAGEIAAMTDEELIDMGLVRTEDPENLDPAEPPQDPAPEPPPEPAP